ncbi:MAG: esterase/lipase family protein [Victivallaceae bacterium]
MLGYLKYLFVLDRPVLRPVDGNGEAVVLVHGLIHRSWVMAKLGRELCRRGYTVYLFDYRTTRGTLAMHAAEFREYLLAVAADFKPGPIHLIAHSMGGLVARLALGNDGMLAPERRGKLIFLAVPHGGSPVAAVWLRRLPGLAQLLVNCLEDLSCRNPGLAELPRPAWETHSIAARFDRKVPLESTSYPHQSARRVVDSGHAFVMDHPDARRAICEILK